MALGAIGKNRVVGGQERSTPSTGGGDDEANQRGSAWKLPGSRTLSIAIAGSMGIRSMPGAWNTVRIQAPQLHCKLQAALLDQEGNFPRRDGRYPGPV